MNEAGFLCCTSRGALAGTRKNMECVLDGVYNRSLAANKYWKEQTMNEAGFLCCTSRGALAGTRNGSMAVLWFQVLYAWRMPSDHANGFQSAREGSKLCVLR